MILASGVVIKNLEFNLGELKTVRTNWTPAYVTEVKNRVDTVATDILGEGNKQLLYESTDKLRLVIDPAIRDISSLKKQIDVDFAKDTSKQKAILKDLGFTDNLLKIQRRSQPAVIAFLLLFGRNIVNYKTEILAKGTSPELITRLTGYAKVIKDANELQEHLKSSTKDLTNDAIAELNEVYTEIIGICKIAADHYLGNTVKKEMFTFDTIAKNMGQTKAKKVNKAGTTTSTKS